jgi:hypothetical protein
MKTSGWFNCSSVPFITGTPHCPCSRADGGRLMLIELIRKELEK